MDKNHEQNLYVRTAVLNKMTCAISFQLQNSRATLTLLLYSPNFLHASITGYTRAKHEPILYDVCFSDPVI